MAKPYENATPICIVLSIIALIGILAGMYFRSPLLTIFSLLPTVVYEVYRTEGESTKAASWGLLGVFILELILILFNVQFDLAAFLGVTEQYIAGYQVTLGDIKIFGPVLMAILSIILMVRTQGKYTKWLAGIIIVTSFALIYVMDPTIFQRYIQMAAQTLFDRISI